MDYRSFRMQNKTDPVVYQRVWWCASYFSIFFLFSYLKLLLLLLLLLSLCTCISFLTVETGRLWRWWTVEGDIEAVVECEGGNRMEGGNYTQRCPPDAAHWSMNKSPSHRPPPPSMKQKPRGFFRRCGG